jgi:hypothetical protein
VELLPRGKLKLVSKESYDKIQERDDLDDFDDYDEEETQVSPELRQIKAERRRDVNQSMEDGKFGRATMAIEPRQANT